MGLNTLFIKNYLTILIIYISVFSTNVLAVSKKNIKNPSVKLSQCVRTKTYLNNYEPKKFNPTNNLLLQQEIIVKDYDQHNVIESVEFPKDFIVLKGRVVNEKCVPVANAKILLWQTDSQGKYVYEPLREGLLPKSKKKAANINYIFHGSGMTYSDEKGDFSFTTMAPGSKKNKVSPYINLRVELPTEDISLQTKLFLDKAKIESMNSDLEYLLTSNKKGEIQPILDNNQYYFQIVIPYDNLFRGFLTP